MASIEWIKGKPYLKAMINRKYYHRRIKVTSQSAAERWLSKFNRVTKDEKLDMLGIRKRSASMEETFGDVFLDYCEHMYDTQREQTIQKKLSRFNVVWFPHFVDRPIKSITTSEVYRILSQRRAEGKAHNTVHNDAKDLKAFFSWAVSEKRVDENPVRKLPAVQLNDIQIPTPAQVESYLSACAWDYYPIPAIAVLAGLRKAEILALDLQDVDFDRMEIRISPESSWKNVQGRSVPMREDLAQILADYIARTPDRNGEHLFVGKDGNRLVCFDKRHRAARKSAEMPWLTFHHFRHAFVSYLLLAGVNLPTVSKLAGHSSSRVTERVYFHLMREERHEMIAKNPVNLAKIGPRVNLQDLAKPSKSMKINGGDDEDRTRDLRRDRIMSRVRNLMFKRVS